MNTAFFLLIIFSIVLVGVRILGYQPYTVVTESMEPTIPVNSIVYVKSVDFDTIKVGDVITYVLSDETTATHRVAKIDNKMKYVLTKGDANVGFDLAPVYEENIVGKVFFHVPFLGRVSSTTKSLIKGVFTHG